MASVVISKQTKIPGFNPSLWGLSTKNPIAEVSSTFPQTGSISVNGTQFLSRVDIVEQLPFKVEFRQVTSENYTRDNVASIGVAIIGHSNYIR
jgi:hypothetical protein